MEVLSLLKKISLYIIFLLPILLKAQCNKTETITICDITTIDFDTDGNPDGIIDLYDEYFKQTGENLEEGTWNTTAEISNALNPNTGVVSVWDIRNSTTNILNGYTFILFTKSCGDDVAVSIDLILGAFQGIALPPFGSSNINLEACQGDLDLFSALTSSSNIPSPHLNGVWTLVSKTPNVSIGVEVRNINTGEITESEEDGTNLKDLGLEPINSIRNVFVEYQPGIPLVDQAIIVYNYTVPGNSSCAISQSIDVRFSVVRQVNAGEGIANDVCESNIKSGDIDVVDLRDDNFLILEDVEGKWSYLNKEGINEIENGDDSEISLQRIYDDLVSRRGIRFGCEKFSFQYEMERRSGVCMNDTTTVDITMFEELRSFQQKGDIPKFCANGTDELNLFEFIEFTTEDGIDFIYNNDQYVNWQQIGGPASLPILKINYACSFPPPPPFVANPTGLHLGIISSYDVIPGIYTFEYGVSPDINCERFIVCNPFSKKIDNTECDCNLPCGIEKTEIKIEILAYDYAGEDTSGVEVCENIENVSLVSLLNSSSEDRSIIETGVWTNENGEEISNTFMITLDTLDKEFNFNYTTTHPTSGCIDIAELNFRVIRENTSPAGESVTVKICSTVEEERNIVLFDQLGGSPVDTGTWTGPGDYKNPDHRAEFVFNDLNFPRLREGDYIYTVIPDISTNCFSENTTATVTIEFVNPEEALETISGIFCKVQVSTDLVNLLPSTIDKTGIFAEVDTTEALTGSIVSFENLAIGSYNFEYTLPKNDNPCEPPTIIIEITLLDEDLAGSAGEDTEIKICSNELSLNLFDQLGGNPVTVGTWTGPFGYRSTDHLGTFSATNPSIQRLAEGVYTYTVGAGQCSTSVDTSTVTIAFVNPIEIGENISITRCKSDGSLNLFSLLDTSTTRQGEFVDTQNTMALAQDGTLDFTNLEGNTYTFDYTVVNENPCKPSVLTIEIRLIDLPIPSVPKATFCILDAKRLNDIEVDVSNFVWYRKFSDTNPIIDNPILVDQDVLYVASIDAENCESSRVEVPIRILNVGEKVELKNTEGNVVETIDCPLDFQDGVSPNQDGENDTFSLIKEGEFNIPEAFPDFSLKIYNRFGTIVFNGNRNTGEFQGENNVDLSLGDILPTGVYFYLFEPNFKNNLPIQGSFYLSR